MNQSWRLKAYLTLFTALLSIYLLVPTFGSFNAIRDEAFKTGKPVPWYLKFFPEKELNLGLDLRGGIYLELEVTVEEAINNRLDLMASELSRYMKEENIQGSADRVAKTHRIRLLVSDPTGLKKVKDHINDIYKGVLQLDSENQELAFSTDEKDEAKLQSLYQDLIAAAKENPSILEVEHPSATNLYRVVLKADAKPDEVKTFVTSKFASLKELNESNKFIYSGVDAYIQKLRSDSVKQAVETIRNRIDRYGVSEPSIRQLGENRVVVELPGVTDPDRAIGIVKKSGKLEFKIVDTSK
ncbi:MAG: hypothetical protein JNK65_00395, partial [Deltaproteobacteria bacterium]|nr:hypothetical protein [Deltaproteobacteria bacterium]